MRNFLLLVFSCGLALSCKSFEPPKSTTKEAPDNMNHPKFLGVAPPYKWDDVKALKSGEAEQPWSDTYWPLMERSMGLRWLSFQNTSAISHRPATLYQMVQDILKAEKNRPDLLHFLSPGEKFDLLEHSVSQIPAPLMQKLKANDDVYMATIKPKYEPLDKEQDKLQKEYEDIYAQLEEKRKKIVEVFNAMKKAQEENNMILVKKLTGEMEAIADSIKKQNEELDKRDAAYQDISKKKREIAKGFVADTIQLARDLAPFVPMTAESWRVWAEYESSDIDDYGWMGLCHGWAVASIMEKKPQHAVMVERGGRKILFTEGDIRGLLTKMWAHQPPDDSAFMGARRCNATKYDTDLRGRVLDGVICWDKKEGECDLASGGKPFYLKQDLMENNEGQLVLVNFSESFHGVTTHVAFVEQSLFGDKYKVRVFQSFADFHKWIQSGRQAVVPTRDALMNVTIGCRDVNPMTFHLALTKLIGQKKMGFVMDKTRSDQVWNQPVYKYDLEYLPVPLNAKDKTNKTLSKSGELVPVKAVDDPFADYRAKGTEYLMVVKAKLHYGQEHGPMADYDRNPGVKDDHAETMEVVYTLELNKDKELIGGEWGPIPLPGEEGAKDEKVRNLIGGEAPDFLWYFGESSKPRRGDYNADLVAKIAACSQEPATGRMKIKDYNKQGKPEELLISYSTCKI